MDLSIIDSIESALDGFGLMRGDFAIPKRFFVGGLLGAFIITYVKPEFMFHEGRPRPWSMLVSDQDSDIPPTSMPWFMFAIGGAVLLGLFI